MKRAVTRSIACLLSLVLVLGLLVIPAPLTAKADGASDPAKILAMTGKTTGITVDGEINEAGWEKAGRHSIEFLADFTISNNKADFMTLWDDEYFYIAVNVIDETVVGTQGGDWTDEENVYNNDGVEIFFDADNSKAKWDKTNDIQIQLRYDNVMKVFGGEGGAPWTDATDKYADMIKHATKVTDKGFDVEVAIPWATFGITPGDGTVVGLSMTNNDNDSRTGNARKEITWSAAHAYGDTSGYGTAILYDTREPVVSLPGSPTVGKNDVKNWDKSIWGFDDSHKMEVGGIDGATIQFASLSDSDNFYLAMLIEGAGDANPAAEFVLDGNNTRSGKVDADDYGYIFQWNPKRAETWQQLNLGRGKKNDGYKTSKYNLGDGSYAMVVQIPWILLTQEGVNGDMVDFKGSQVMARRNGSLISFNVTAGTAQDLEGYGIENANSWIDGYNAWGGTALDKTASIVICNPNLVPVDTNAAPEGTEYYTYSISQGGTVSGTVKVTDANVDDTLAFSLEEGFDTANGTVTVDEKTGAWTYTAPNDTFVTEGASSVSFFVVATDTAGAKHRTRVEIKVEYKPTNLTYHVNGDTGNDTNDGLSADKALKTLQAASDKTKPGDTVIIHESKVPYGWYTDEEYAADPDLYGTVRNGVLVITRSGLPDAPITYKAAEGEQPVVKGNGIWDTVVVSANYIVLEGITVNGLSEDQTYEDAFKAFWGKMAATDDPEYIASWGREIGAYNTNGIGVAPAKGHKIEGGKSVTDPAVSIPHHIIIRKCVAEFVGGSGIGGSQCDYVTFENCTAINNCWWGMYGNSGLGFIELVDTDDNTEDFKIVIRNCISAGNRHFIPWMANTVRLSDGNGIIMDTCDEHAHSYRGKTLIANNLVYENGGSGIHSFRSDNVYVVNNTIFNNNATLELTWGELFSNDSLNMHMYNNIVCSRDGVAENPKADDDKNGYNLFFNYKDSSVIKDADGNILGQDPQFANSSPVVHMPAGFDTAKDYDTSWYETKTAASGKTPDTWTMAANAAAAGWYPEAVYDAKTYEYDFTLSESSPARGKASADWQKIAGGESYDNVIGIFSEVGAKIESVEKPGTVTVTPSATVTGDSAASTVTDSMGDAIINQAEKNNSSSVVIKPDMPDDVTSAEVTVPGDTLAELGERTKADVTVKTPAGNVTIPNEALEKLGEGSKVAVAVEKDEENGAVTVGVKMDGETVDEVPGGIRIAVPVEDGKTLVAVDEDGNETVIRKSLVEDGTAYALLDGSATVKAADNSMSFVDVTVDERYGDAIDFVSGNGLFNGVENNAFAPDSEMNRAMLVTVLWRLESMADANGGVRFPDVGSDTWYSDSVAWASANGIIKGVGNGAFEPGRAVTREETAVMLYRYSKVLGLDICKRGSTDAFADGADVSGWAKTEVEWAIGVGLLQGSDGKLNPTASPTRAEAAAIFQRLVVLIVK